MLILTRKCGERIRIGDDITITVLRVEAGQVRIGVEAPREVPVHREEIYHKIAELQPETASTGGSAQRLSTGPAAKTGLPFDSEAFGGLGSAAS